MNKPNEFNGDVGQVVMGNSTVGPTLSNQVHVKIGDEGKKITKAQRHAIWRQVKQVAEANQCDPKQIYIDLLVHFGAENMDEFPREKYLDASAWLKNLLNGIDIDETIDPYDLKLYNLQQAVNELRQRFKFMLWGSVALISILILAMIVNSQSQAAQERQIDVKCHLDGRTYSVGSMVKMVDGSLKECVGVGGGDSFWTLAG
nr:hypothetical protein [uncultured Undibacterium sp.]